jgi:hypothetical protein
MSASDDAGVAAVSAAYAIQLRPTGPPGGTLSVKTGGALPEVV